MSAVDRKNKALEEKIESLLDACKGQTMEGGGGRCRRGGGKKRRRENVPPRRQIGDGGVPGLLRAPRTVGLGGAPHCQGEKTDTRPTSALNLSSPDVRETCEHALSIAPSRGR